MGETLGREKAICPGKITLGKKKNEKGHGQ